MGGAKRTTWIGGAAFVALVILAMSWFLAISPKLADAGDVRAQAQQVRDQNDLLETKLVKLKADFEKLDEYKAELAAIQGQIPVDTDLAEYLRQLDAIATAHSVTLTNLVPGQPAAVVLAAAPTPASTTAATEGTDAAEGTEEAEGTAADAPAAATADTSASAVPTGFMSIPMQLTLVGTYENALAFTSDLQNGTTRLFLVSALQATGQPEAEATGGKPATAAGDVELVVTGYLYVLPDSLGSDVTAVDPAAPAPALPGAVGGKNGYVPIPGH